MIKKLFLIFAFIALKNRFAQMNFSGIGDGKISPVLLMLIGASSAVGFIFVETLFQLVFHQCNSHSHSFELVIWET